MSESNPTPSPNSPPGAELPLDFDFLHRVYRTAIIVTAIITLFIWEGAGRAGVIGFLLGAVLSLIGLYVTEWTIRRYITPEASSTTGLMAVSLLKLFLVMALIFGAFWAATKGWLNLLWALPGFMVPHAVLLLKLAGRKVLRMIGSTGRSANQ